RKGGEELPHAKQLTTFWTGLMVRSVYNDAPKATEVHRYVALLRSDCSPEPKRLFNRRSHTLPDALNSVAADLAPYVFDGAYAGRGEQSVGHACDKYRAGAF